VQNTVVFKNIIGQARPAGTAWPSCPRKAQSCGLTHTIILLIKGTVVTVWYLLSCLPLSV
jgi:hypothetical protein